MRKRILSIIFATIVGFSLSATAVAAEAEEEFTNSTSNIEPESSSHETEISCTEICHINISYELEYYVIDNLCPTGEVESMDLEAEFSVEKGHELEVNLDEVSPEVEDIISEVDELAEEINYSYEISASVTADGEVTINNISSEDAEEVSCEVTILSDSEKSKDKMEDEEIEDNSLESEELEDSNLESEELEDNSSEEKEDEELDNSSNDAEQESSPAQDI